MLWFSAKGKPQSVVEDYYPDATQKEWLQRSPKCLDFYFLCSHCYANTCIHLKKRTTTTTKIKIPAVKLITIRQMAITDSNNYNDSSGYNRSYMAAY